MSGEVTLAGGCACGRIRFTAAVIPHEAYLCHCRMCQRASGSISLAMVNARISEVHWEHEPDWYDSSPIAERPFCRECGTTLGFRFKNPDLNMDLTVAAFDDPARFTPRHHFGAESMQRAWLNTEGLKEIRTDEHPTLKDRWIDATGEFPG
ncbi:MAG TPA: GFA family protein [Sphingomicrobium sp.]